VRLGLTKLREIYYIQGGCVPNRDGLTHLLCDFGLNGVKVLAKRRNAGTYQNGINAIVDVLAIIQLLVDVFSDTDTPSFSRTFPIDLR
jgi:hypothetical protein